MQSKNSNLVEGGEGTFENPKTVSSNQEESRVTAQSIPEEKGTTMITISSSSMTRQMMQASSSSTSNGNLVEEKAKNKPDMKLPTPPARKRNQETSEKQAPEMEAVVTEQKQPSPVVRDVPIKTEGAANVSEATCEEAALKPATETEQKYSDEIKNPVPPPRAANAQPSSSGICCNIL